MDRLTQIIQLKVTQEKEFKDEIKKMRESTMMFYATCIQKVDLLVDQAKTNPVIAPDLMRVFGMQLSTLLEFEQQTKGSKLFIKHLKDISQKVEANRIILMKLPTLQEKINALLIFRRELRDIALNDEREEERALEKVGDFAFSA